MQAYHDLKEDWPDLVKFQNGLGTAEHLLRIRTLHPPHLHSHVIWRHNFDTRPDLQLSDLKRAYNEQ